MRKQKKQTIVLSSDSEDDIDSAEVAKNRGTAKTAQNAANNASIITTGKTVNTIVGPIGEWACVPENLPNHPTMVRTLSVNFRRYVHAAVPKPK